MRRTQLLPFAALLALAGACSDADAPITSPATPDGLRLVKSLNDTTISSCSPGSGCTGVIAGAVQRFRTVRFGAGTFEINDEIAVPSDTRLVGAPGGGSLIRQTANDRHIFVASGAAGSPVTGVTVDSLVFRGRSSNGKTALRVGTGQTIRFRYNDADSIGLITTTSLPEGYANAHAGNLTRDVQVTGNTGRGRVGGNAPTINLTYTRDATISGNTLTDVANGIVVWGGDANHNANGALANPRWARNITIQDNQVHRVGFGDVPWSGAGIMSSMGDSVWVLRNHVTNCGDVCLDAEGTYNAWFTENTGKNATFGVLASFYFSRNVTFNWNDVEQDGSYGNQLFALRNESSEENQVSVAVQNNVFRWTGASGVGRITKEMSQSLTFVNNTLTNAVVAFDGCSWICQWNGYLEITGNKLTFNRDAGRPAIVAGRNWMRPSWLAGNELITSVAQSAEGIRVILDSHPYATQGDHMWVMNNIVPTAWSPSIVLESSDPMAQTFHVEGNTGNPCRKIFSGGTHNLLLINNSWGSYCTT